MAPPNAYRIDDAAALRAAAAHLHGGGLLAVPTDTVPGLAVRAGDAAAAARLAAAKGSAPDRPWSVHLADRAALARLTPSLPPGLPRWLAARLPGPLTVVLPKEWVALPLDWDWPWPAVGFRVPAHAGYQAFLAALADVGDDALWMTSINPSGTPPLEGPARTAFLEERGIPRLEPLAAASTGSPSAVVRFEPLPQLLRGTLPPDALRPGLRVLIVCTGNICRSPLAAALFRMELAAAWGVRESDLAALGWDIRSAGTFAMEDSPATPESALAGAEVGADLSAHRAVHAEDLFGQEWDLVLGMTERHLAPLPDRWPKRLFDPLGNEVPDPFGGDLAIYRSCRDHLHRAVQQWVEEWSSWPRA